jgi:hemerythrin
LIFRTLWEGGYKTYVHLADIPSLKVMDDYLIKADDATTLASRLREDLSEAMFSPADVKKVDAGGGSIHGDARDFEGDRSAKIVLSHTSSEFTNEQKEIGSNAAFGTQDVLIKSTRDYTLPLARGYLESHFPNATKYDLDMLLNCPVMSLNSGEFVIRKGIETEYLYLVLGGVVEMIDSSRNIQRNVLAGTLIGELSALRGETPNATYRTKSFANLLQIPADLYIGFVQRNLDIKETLRLSERTLFLQGTWLFGEAISSTVQNRIAQVATELRVRAGDKVGEDNDDCLYLVRDGQARLMFDETQVDLVGPGQFFGEESVFFKRSSMMTAFAVRNTQLFVIPAQILSGIPVAVWKLLEVYERRLMSFGSLVSKS